MVTVRVRVSIGVCDRVPSLHLQYTSRHLLDSYPHHHSLKDDPQNLDTANSDLLAILLCRK